jgi:hypothetical protein
MWLLAGCDLRASASVLQPSNISFIEVLLKTKSCHYYKLELGAKGWPRTTDCHRTGWDLGVPVQPWPQVPLVQPFLLSWSQELLPTFCLQLHNMGENSLNVWLLPSEGLWPLSLEMISVVFQLSSGVPHSLSSTEQDLVPTSFPQMSCQSSATWVDSNHRHWLSHSSGGQRSTIKVSAGWHQLWRHREDRSLLLPSFWGLLEFLGVSGSCVGPIFAFIVTWHSLCISLCSHGYLFVRAPIIGF